MRKIDPAELQTVSNKELSSFYQKEIVLSPIYLSENHIQKQLPSFFIMIEDNFYMHYYIHDWENSHYLTQPEYCNSPYTDNYLVDGERITADILPEKLIHKIKKEGLYICENLEEIPASIQKLYKEFYLKEFKHYPDYNLIFDMNTWLETIKNSYQNELDFILRKKKTLLEHDKLNNLLKKKNYNETKQIVKI